MAGFLLVLAEGFAGVGFPFPKLGFIGSLEFVGVRDFIAVEVILEEGGADGLGVAAGLDVGGLIAGLLVVGCLPMFNLELFVVTETPGLLVDDVAREPPLVALTEVVGLLAVLLRGGLVDLSVGLDAFPVIGGLTVFDVLVVLSTTCFAPSALVLTFLKEGREKMISSLVSFNLGFLSPAWYSVSNSSCLRFYEEQLLILCDSIVKR